MAKKEKSPNSNTLKVSGEKKNLEVPSRANPDESGKIKLVKVPKKRINDGLKSPESVSLPLETTYTDEDRALLHAQRRAQVEILMLKGITEVHQLASLLGMNRTTISKAIEDVHARWLITGGGRDLRRAKGMALRKNRMLESELWVTFTNTDDDRVKIATSKMILDVMDRENQLTGIYRYDAEKEKEVDSGKNKSNYDEIVAQHKDKSEIAKKLLELISVKGSKIIN